MMQVLPVPSRLLELVTFQCPYNIRGLVVTGAAEGMITADWAVGGWRVMPNAGPIIHYASEVDDSTRDGHGTDEKEAASMVPMPKMREGLGHGTKQAVERVQHCSTARNPIACRVT